MRFFMSPRPPFPLTLLFLAMATLPLLAQKPEGQKNLLGGGNFERSTTSDNLWDGVDNAGYLASHRFSVPALAETGIRKTAMPVSVKLADLNGDQLPDIVTADPLGYHWVYFNSGTPTEPKFTTGELIPLFLWQPVGTSTNLNFLRRVPKIDVADFTGDGLLDLVIGLYGGEVAVIPNTGAAATPVFQQPQKVGGNMVQTTQSGHRWGNLFAPVAKDWDGDGKIDLLLGEGSYSANSVHLLLNSGKEASPTFTDEQRHYLAYGNGREHLHPAVVDLNGDGKQDIVVSDREGKLSLYLNKTENWKPGDQLDFTSTISLGGSNSQKNLISLSAGDYNGDGKADLLIGKTNGRVAVALNTGTPTEPKFSAPTEIKGTDVYGRNVRQPAGWDISTGLESGNAWAVITAVDAATDSEAAPPEGQFALKAYYEKPLNKIIPSALVEHGPTNQNLSRLFGISFKAEDYEYLTGSRVFVMVHVLPDLKVGGAYQLSFKYKGRGVRGAAFRVGYRGHVKIAPDKVTQAGGRGVKVESFDKAEDALEAGTFSPEANWKESSKTISVKFKARELRDLKMASSPKLVVTFELTGFDSVLYLDDFQFVEK